MLISFHFEIITRFILAESERWEEMKREVLSVQWTESNRDDLSRVWKSYVLYCKCYSIPCVDTDVNWQLALDIASIHKQSRRWLSKSFQWNRAFIAFRWCRFSHRFFAHLHPHDCTIQFYFPLIMRLIISIVCA